MRIAVDGRTLAAGRGIARYTRCLLQAVAAAPGGGDWRVLVPGREPVDAPLPLVRHAAGSRLLFGAAALTGRPRLDRLVGGADVVWAPAPAPLAVSAGIPIVLTVHDLSWIARPADFTPYERAWHVAARVPALVERAARVITVSAATRDALLARWDIAPEKVVVVPSGPGMTGITPPPPEPSAGRSYLLAVGALEPRKAPDLLARAHARARAQGLRAELWFAGEGRIRPTGAGIRILGPQDDASLARLYAGALALVHPALLEGFAFPPVEALAQGTPVVAADLPVLDETVGAGALRVAPGDEAALADALLRVEREPVLRRQLVRDGRAAISVLSWERAAAQTRAVLEEAAGA